ncbi:hypothetical protein L3Q82_009436, partial [Scortum barcoo]
MRLEQELGSHCRQRSQGPEGVRFGNHRISSLLLQMMLSCWLHQARTFSMYWSGLQPSRKCEAAGMRISTSKSARPWFSTRKGWWCPLRVGGEVLPQMEEFKYLGVLFTSEGKMECEIDRQIGAASAVMQRSLCTGPS